MPNLLYFFKNLFIFSFGCVQSAFINVTSCESKNSEIVFDSNLNNIGYVHLSNKLVSFKKHKLVESKVSDEANNSELASILWILSEEICRSFGFVTFNI